MVKIETIKIDWDELDFIDMLRTNYISGVLTTRPEIVAEIYLQRSKCCFCKRLDCENC